jgi:hypothetical protein
VIGNGQEYRPVVSSGEFKSLRDNFKDIIKMLVPSTSWSAIRPDRSEKIDTRDSGIRIYIAPSTFFEV